MGLIGTGDQGCRGLTHSDRLMQADGKLFLKDKARHWVSRRAD